MEKISIRQNYILAFKNKPKKNLSKISFSGKRLIVQDIELNEYLALSEKEKLRLRSQADNFKRRMINHSNELFEPTKTYLPLLKEHDMQQFINFSKLYNPFKKSPIMCLGRSPKWPIETSTWMKDGLDNYIFTAFSKYWYKPIHDRRTGDRYLEKSTRLMPTQGQENSYKLYLKLLKVDPENILKKVQKAGTEMIITDYVEKSKGFTSFLDLMSRYAKKQGVLEEFAKSIKFVLIGSKEYSERFFLPDEHIPSRKVFIPETLREVIPMSLWGDPFPKQEYHDMPLNIFEQMLINENTNECRSSFYPKDYWLKFKPLHSKPTFTPALKNFRNLLNFRILDYLNAQNLIKKL